MNIQLIQISKMGAILDNIADPQLLGMEEIRIRDEHPRPFFRVFWVKNTKSFDADPDLLDPRFGKKNSEPG